MLTTTAARVSATAFWWSTWRFVSAQGSSGQHASGQHASGEQSAHNGPQHNSPTIETEPALAMCAGQLYRSGSGRAQHVCFGPEQGQLHNCHHRDAGMSGNPRTRAALATERRLTCQMPHPGAHPQIAPDWPAGLRRPYGPCRSSCLHPALVLAELALRTREEPSRTRSGRRCLTPPRWSQIHPPRLL